MSRIVNYQISQQNSSTNVTADEYVNEYSLFQNNPITPKKVVQLLDTGEIANLPIINPSTSALYTFSSGGAGVYALGLVELNPNEYLAMYSINGLASYAQKFTLSDDNIITKSNSFLFDSEVFSSGKLIKIDNNTVLFLSVSNSIQRLYARVFTVNTDGTLTAKTTSTLFDNTYSSNTNICIEQIAVNSWIIGWQYSTYRHAFKVINWNGTSLTIGNTAFAVSPTGTTASDSASELTDICKYDTNKFLSLMQVRNGSTGNNGTFVYAITVNSTTITIETPISIDSYGNNSSGSCFLPISNTKVLVLYEDSNVRYSFLTITNNIITYTAPQTLLTLGDSRRFMNGSGSLKLRGANRYMTTSFSLPIFSTDGETVSMLKSNNTSPVVSDAGSVYAYTGNAHMVATSNDRVVIVTRRANSNIDFLVCKKATYGKEFGIAENSTMVRTSGVSKSFINLTPNTKYKADINGTLYSTSFGDADAYGIALSPTDFKILKSYTG